jgi:hypothetical protein
MPGRQIEDRDYPLATLKHVEEVDPVLIGGMELPYFWRRVALWRRKERSPRFLYKFKALRRPHTRQEGESPFTAESIEHLRVIIVRSLLRLSSPDDFNDPFEMSAHWVIEGTTKERVERFTALMKEQMPRANFKERERAVLKLMETPAADLLPIVRGSYTRQRHTFGICCFAGRDPANVLMWSHYADEHRGICLQFELAKDLLVLMRAISVDYIDEYPTLNWIHPSEVHDGIGSTFTRKHTRWKYEGEHRILLEGQARTYLKFDPSALTGIIFGCRADEEVKGCVGSLLEERAGRGMPPVELYYARQNTQRYELDITSH